ncbi:MAG: alpha-galactosidase [Oscillospiraceae bacterium]|nr:alpha-galactosidase [Oscillospiraceae bacterium]
MAIEYRAERRTLTLLTDGSAYQMQLGALGYLLHLYYGPRCGDDLDYLHLPRDCGFSPNPHELTEGRGFSLDTLPQEYSGSNGADFRLPSVALETAAGVVGADLHVKSWEIRPGKYALAGLPASFAAEDEAETLAVTLSDEASGLEVELLYGVFPARDVITRAARIRNAGSERVTLRKAASACLDLPFGRWDFISFHGRHAMERQLERAPVRYGLQSAASRRGTSSHHNDPFTILCAHDATEDHGACYGLMPVYSGSHRTDVELDQGGSVRAVAGINPDGFSWRLLPGEAFETPELILAFSDEGLTGLSHRLHRFLRRNLIRGGEKQKRLPVLLNSWEACYFGVDEARMLALARGAKELGAGMLVLDDGWFANRFDDRRALGDWTVNREKFPGGLAGLHAKLEQEGMAFGLWVEPEMVSEDSALFRAHPDWALRVPGRPPALGRDQLVLDLGREEVAEYLHETLAALLRESGVCYVKWDMNRSICDVYSAALPPERQGEAAHRYMLGLYRLLDRLTGEFPEVLFEGCSGGGGRFDAGILAWCPQIWLSDDTDPIARLSIQQGASYGYPVAAVGAHVSASPNHQTGRTTPLGTRCTVAMAGSFGFELDPASLSEAEKAELCSQTAFFLRCRETIHNGLFYRLCAEDEAFTAWQFVAEDGHEALLTLVLKNPEANPAPLHLRLKGLDPAARYRLSDCAFFGCRNTPAALPRAEYSGAALLHAGLTLPQLLGDYPSARLLFEKL